MVVLFLSKNLNILCVINIGFAIGNVTRCFTLTIIDTNNSGNWKITIMRGCIVNSADEFSAAFLWCLIDLFED